MAGGGGELRPLTLMTEQSNHVSCQLFLGTLVDENLDPSLPRTQQTTEKRQLLHEKVGSHCLSPYSH